MAISTYSDLKQAVQDWMDRTDISGNVEDMITLAEARFNRKLKVVETNATLTGTADSRSIDISALDIVSPVALKINDGNGEWDLTPRENGTFAYGDIAGTPSFWSIDGTNIVFDVPLGQQYTFRFRYQGRFALSGAVPSNWLLEKHPDIYLAASIVWGGLFTEDDRKIATWKGVLDEGMAEVSGVLNQNKRGRLTVDPALSAIGWKC